MGRRFAETANEFGQFDEIWAVARREEKLKELGVSAPFPVRPVAMDLSDPASVAEYAALLKEAEVEVGLLVNASGFGRFQAVMDVPAEENLNMIDLNCRAVAAMCQASVPYMSSGSAIINIASVAAFQPIPFISIYAATKAFVLYYSRALNRELKGKGIRVMALCPFWTKTEFFNRAVAKDEKPVVKKYVAMYRPEDIVARAWRDVARGKDVSMYGFIARGQALLVKLLPHRFVMSTWQKQQKLLD